MVGEIFRVRAECSAYWTTLSKWSPPTGRGFNFDNWNFVGKDEFMMVLHEGPREVTFGMPTWLGYIVLMCSGPSIGRVLQLWVSDRA